MNCANANANGQFKLMTLPPDTHTQNAQTHSRIAAESERKSIANKFNHCAQKYAMQYVQHQMTQALTKVLHTFSCKLKLLFIYENCSMLRLSIL